MNWLNCYSTVGFVLVNLCLHADTQYDSPFKKLVHS